MLGWHSFAGVAPGEVAQSRGDGVGSGSSRRRPSRQRLQPSATDCSGEIKMQKINHILFQAIFRSAAAAWSRLLSPWRAATPPRSLCSAVVQPFYYAAMGDAGARVVVDVTELLRDLKTRLDSSLTLEFSGLRVDRVAETRRSSAGDHEFRAYARRRSNHDPGACDPFPETPARLSGGQGPARCWVPGLAATHVAEP
jgi:hypothetical protein